MEFLLFLMHGIQMQMTTIPSYLYLLNEVKEAYGGSNVYNSIRRLVERISTVLLKEAGNLTSCRELLKLYNQEMEDEVTTKKQQGNAVNR